MSSIADNIERIYELSPMQAGMLFETLYAPESGVYTTQIYMTLASSLDPVTLHKAWQQVVDRHPVLRTFFVWDELDKPLQIVRKHVQLPWETQDWRAVAHPHARLAAFLDADRKQGFALDTAPLVRCTLIRTEAERYTFVWSSHHILMDGWSLPILWHEVLTFYEAARSHTPRSLPPPRPYSQYIAWLQRQDMAQAEAYWRTRLAGCTAPTPLHVDKARRPGETASGSSEYALTLPKALCTRLEALARAHHVTLNTVVQGAWALLLRGYSGQDDVVFGATVSGRPAALAGVESMVGLFINTLPVRVQIQAATSVVALLHAMQRHQAEREEYAYTPLVDIQRWSEVPPRTPLFESIVVYENYPFDTALSTQASGLITEVGSVEQTHYPLALIVALGQALSVQFTYDPGRFEAATVARMAGHFARLVEGMVAHPEEPIQHLTLLSEAERAQVLHAWNATTTAYPQDTCLHALFEAQVARTPEALAVVFDAPGPAGPASLTYGALNTRANQLAHHLRGLGVGPETLVGLCLERSLEMVVALLGVLKAGGAYVPLDPTLPPARLAFMLADTQVAVLVTHAHLAPHLPAAAAPVVCLDTAWATIAQHSGANPGVAMTSAQLAYVIYTSGSTGQPKGVLNTHAALVAHCCAMQATLALTARDRVLHFSPLHFDASLDQLLPALLSGAQVVVAAAPLSIEDCSRHIRQRGLTILDVPPAYWQAAAEAWAAAPALLAGQRLRLIIVGGDVLPVGALATWRQTALHGVPVLNAYGPTEATITTTTYSVAADFDLGRRSVPIGRPLANKPVYVLDAQGEPVPIGVPGELCIGGVGLARGYLQQPALTAERFRPAPGLAGPGGRLYRTGDVARWLPDGTLEFLGRLDAQVKLRGFRIELGEIEAVLGAHPGVQAVVVVVWEAQPGQSQLVAYVVGREAEGPDQGPGGRGPAGAELRAALRRHVQEQLPDYMRPAAYVMLAALPVTPHGKVDRRALPAPDRRGGAHGSRAPGTPTEATLAAIWREVLGLEQVGVEDNFFALGGHSLLSIQVVVRLRQGLGLDVPLRTLFEAPTIATLSPVLDQMRQAVQAAQLPPIARVDRTAPVPLSFAQERLWFLDQLEEGSSTYNIPGVLRLRGRLDVEALEQSLQDIVRRHESLRTTFVAVDGVPGQVIGAAQVTLPVIDLRGLEAEAQAAEVRRRAAAEAQQGFDLRVGPLVRVQLLRVGRGPDASPAAGAPAAGEEAAEHVLLLTVHHIVADGWSIEIFVRELAALYTARRQGRPGGLAALALQYADFAVWQRQWLAGAVMAAHLAYWRAQLAGAPPVLALPTDRPRPPLQTFHGAHLRVALAAELAAQVRQVSRESGSTVFMTLLAAFKVLLMRYSGQEDVVVGVPVANRTRVEIEPLIGFFVNTVVLRSNLAGNPPFRAVLAQVHERTLEAYDHQEVPFEKVVEELQPQRNLSHAPLFQVMFVLQNAPKAALVLPELALEALEFEVPVAKFDLTLAVQEEAAGGLSCEWEYNTDLFEAATVARMAGHFARLVEGMVAHPEEPIQHLSLLSEAERAQVLHAWNATTTAYPQDTCLHALFEAQVARTPEALAVVFDAPGPAGPEAAAEPASLTYGALNTRANQLAHHLRGLGVGPETLVGLCLERSLEMVVALLGVLKAGGAYVPLDPTLPPARLAFMLADTQVAVLVTHAHLAPHLPAAAAPVVCLDTAWATIAQHSGANPGVAMTSAQLAYVIYTSGSTGQPKGVLNTHAALVAHCCAMQATLALTARDRVLHFSPLHFDASLDQLLPALLSGAQVVVAAAPLSIEDCSRHIRQRGLTILDVPPAYWQAAAEAWAAAPALLAGQRLRLIIVGGDVLPVGALATWRQTALHGVPVLNAYGPTEATITTTTYSVAADFDLGRRSVPIGRPLANKPVYVLDAQGEPVPIGVPGELCIGGVGLARGYLQQPALTAERFRPAPGLAGPGGRLYRTGDVARWLPDGTLELLGRLDQQVKLRGFRIELGEIEAVLGAHPGVQAVVVVVWEAQPGQPQLVAYVVGREAGDADGAPPGAEPAAAELRAALRRHVQEQLPDYMRPAAYVVLAALPVTPHGKVDRRALPAPDRRGGAHGSRAPGTPTEATLAAIWQEVLGLEQVGVEDNFFELGGDSILIIQVVARAQQAALHLTPRQMFQHQTIAALVDVVGTVEPLGAEQGLVTGPVPLTPIQQWFLTAQQPNPHHFNQAVLLEVAAEVNPAWLADAVQGLLRHHDGLRLRFTPDGDGWRQDNVAPDADVPCTVFDWAHLGAEERRRQLAVEAAKLHASLHLTTGPLLGVALFWYGGGQASRLLLVIHHLAVDGVSWRILGEDLETLYQQIGRGAPMQLPPKTTAFRDWARWLAAHGPAAVAGEVAYWQQLLEAPEEALPVDTPHGVTANTEASADEVSCALAPEETAALLREVPAVYHTQVNDVLLTALLQSVCQWGGTRAVLIDVEGHGREVVEPGAGEAASAWGAGIDLSRTVGWFTSLFPVRLALDQSHPGALLKSVKEQLRHIPNRGMGYGVLRYLGQGAGLAARRQAAISFNYLGQLDAAVPSPRAPLEAAAAPRLILGLAQEASGPAVSPQHQRGYLLEINCWVLEGQLQMHWLYSRNIHQRETIATLARAYVEALQALIAHCLSPDAGGYTPSDFSATTLDQTELDALLNELGS